MLDAERCEEMELLMRAKYTENSCIVNELTSRADLEMMLVNQRGEKRRNKQLKIVAEKLGTVYVFDTCTAMATAAKRLS